MAADAPRTLEDLVSREVVELPEDGTSTYTFGGVVVADARTGAVVELRGPVDVSRFAPLRFQFTRRDGILGEGRGFSLIVLECNGAPCPRRRLNLVTKRLIEQLLPDLRSGAYLRTKYTITASGAAPKTHYSVERTTIA